MGSWTTTLFTFFSGHLGLESQIKYGSEVLTIVSGLVAAYLTYTIAQKNKAEARKIDAESRAEVRKRNAESEALEIENKKALLSMKILELQMNDEG